MASNSSSDPAETPQLKAPRSEGEPGPSPEALPDTVGEPESDAVRKFRSCRWRRPPDEGPECCGHRDVLPLAGTTEFNPDAWCPDCTYFKMRRAPRRRERQDYW